MPWLALEKGQTSRAAWARCWEVVRSYRPLLAELGLTYSQYLVRLVLWEADEPVPLKFIDSRLGLDSGSLTPLFKRLEKQGFVQRWREPDDERRTLAALTADGASLRTRAECIPEAMAEAFKEVGLGLAEFKESLDLLAVTPVEAELPWLSEEDFAGVAVLAFRLLRPI